MSSEPNHPMDRALNTYAAKRRQDAGAPLELHPATRQMLQAEVARNASRSRGDLSSWAQLLTGWLPRLAATAVLCAFLGLIGWMLFQPDSLRREQSLAQLSRNEVLLKDNIPAPAPDAENQPMIAPLASATPAAAPAPVIPILPARPAEASAPKVDSFSDAVTLAETGFRRQDSPATETLNLAATTREKAPSGLGGGIAGGAGVRELKDVAMTESISETKRLSQPTGTVRQRAEPTPTFAPQKNLLAGTKAEDGLAKTKLAESQKSEALGLRFTAVPPPAVAAPTAPEPAAGAAMLPERRARGALTSAVATGPTQAQSFYFRQTPALADARVDLRKKADAASVLTSFSWQQTGRQLRVVDADGSVYLGEAQEPGTPALAESSPVQAAAKPVTTAGRQNLAPATFRVSGTNKTLRQRIVISGQLLRESELVAARAYAFDKEQPAPEPANLARNRAAQQPAAAPVAALPKNATQSDGSSLRIEAQVTLGDGQVLPIRAVSR